METSKWEILWASSIIIVTFMLSLPFFTKYLPSLLDHFIFIFFSRMWRLIFYPYVEITFSEYAGEDFKRSEVYAAIEAYLSTFCSDRADRLKAAPRDDGTNVILSMDDREEVIDKYKGVKFWWCSNKKLPLATSIYFQKGPEEESRYYRLTFYRRRRHLARNDYIGHVIERGKEIAVNQRQRKLYTNAKMDSSNYHKALWCHVPFNHPATFKTLAMEHKKKHEIMEDLICFSQGKKYYESVGKPWKRGYLLYGPPGTRKSTMIAAMANFLNYDVYDLELTSVKNNTALRKLLIETKSKSIIVIEDIDCTLELWEKMKKKASAEAKNNEENLRAALNRDDNEESKVTLSGLLNFIDGLWSTCGSERIIVFTTNHVEKLDPALLRSGRMDMHIEMSYCSFEGLRVLAKNYLGLETSQHSSLDTIKMLLKENKISSADAAESLMPKSQSPNLFNDEIQKKLEEGKISLEEVPILMPKSGSDVTKDQVSRSLGNLINFIKNECKFMSRKDFGSSCATMEKTNED